MQTVGDPVLVANRGEIAVRVLGAVQELGRRAVAVHPEDDAASAHVSRADQALLLPGQGVAAYLDVQAVVGAATRAGCTALHPGYGFLSENAALARACAAAGVTFVGPRAELLELFGDKARARRHALDQGVPVLPGTTGPTTEEEARAFAAEHGPVMLKALHGGGGRGMRAVHDPAGLTEAYARCRSEATQAFGNGDLYVEKLLTAPRHVEVQVVGDRYGAVQHLGERDCSIQRRHQKLVEVAPSPSLDDAVRRRVLQAALTLAEAARYDSLGTFEFLLDGDEVYFLEANPRVQVEHTVTEEVTGVDLVKAQLRLADGASLADLGLAEPPVVRGFAVQARVNLETLATDGTPMPATGVIGAFAPPTGPGVRVDTYGYAGYRVSPRYDSLVAKVVCRGDDWPSAVARLEAALGAFRLDGVATNLDLLQAVARHPEVAAGRWDTGFLERHLDGLRAHVRATSTHGKAATEPVTQRVDVPEGAVPVTAPLAGIVVSVEAPAGTVLGAGGVLVVLEAMKMEHVVRTEAPMTVDAVLVAAGDAVDAGAVLAHGSPADGGAAAQDAVREPGWAAEVEEIARRRQAATAMGGPTKVERQHATGRLTARERIAALADPGTFAEIGALTALPGPDGSLVPANFLAGTARLDGRKVMLGVDDFTVRGGSGDGAVSPKQRFSEAHAGEMRLPVVRLLDGASGGGSVKMAMDAGFTYVPANPAWDAVVDNLSLVPVVAACLGPTVGLGAARAAMAHLTIMVRGVGQLFTAGPPLVLAATGEDLTKEQLGGVDVHRDNGTVERFVDDEQAAFDVVRRFLSYLPSSVFELPPVTPGGHDPGRTHEALLDAVPRNPRRLYEIEPLLDAVFDAGSVFPYAEYGSGTWTGLARLDGHPVGVIAADPPRGAGMSVEGALAVTRLVDLCETFHLPVVSLTDQAGVLIGAQAERRGTIRHGARAIAAVYQARIPQAEVIVRRVYGVGGAGIVNRHRAVRSWAWPSGDWGSLPSQGGIEAAFRAQLDAAADRPAELERLSRELAEIATPFRTAERFGVQDLIDPRETRPLLCEWVRDAYRLLPELLGRPSFGTRP